MSDVIKIQSSLIPTVYPYYSYKDISYADECSRPIRIGLQSELFETERLFRATTGNDKENYINRKIQVILYEKYEIQLFSKENNLLDLLRFSGDLQITLPDGTIHLARIIDELEGERQAGTSLFAYNITYIDLSSEKVVNYLKSDIIRDTINGLGVNFDLKTIYMFINRYTHEQLVLGGMISFADPNYDLTIPINDFLDTLTVGDAVTCYSNVSSNRINAIGEVLAKTSTTITIRVPISGNFSGYTQSNISFEFDYNDSVVFYTILDKYITESDRQEETENFNGIELPSTSYSQTIYNYHLYLNESDAAFFMKWAANSFISVEDDSTRYAQVERVVPEINDIGGSDIREIILPLKINNTVYEKYK